MGYIGMHGWSCNMLDVVAGKSFDRTQGRDMGRVTGRRGGLNDYYYMLLQHATTTTTYYYVIVQTNMYY